MERYGHAGDEEEDKEESPSDPSLQWTPPVNEPGIQVNASMWRLGLGDGGGESYPERPDEPDCIYYLRTGACGYGSRCRFNHPPPNPAPVLGDLRTDAAEFPERMGQPLCQHYMRTGTCRYGASCKYHHPRHGGRGGGGGGGGAHSSVTPTSLNHMGFPLRPGEKECSYYMRTGQCKFGSTCRFHHPVPPLPQPPPSQQPIPSSQQYGVVIPRPQLLPGPYVQSPYGYSPMFLPPPGMVPYSGAWSPYQAIPPHGTQPLSPSAPAYQSGLSNNEQQQPFPQRPGQPECQYFIRTGDCKFGSSCRFHHPLDAISPSHIRLPLRPGSSSLTDMPDASHPLGSSSSVTLAPSSSPLPDQHAELLSTKPKATTSGGSETVAAGVSSSSASHPEPPKSKGDDSGSIEAKT